MNILYKQLAEGGGYNLPYLIHIFNETKSIELYLINDNKPMTYNGHLYKPSTFTYTPNEEGESTFNVELVETDTFIDLLENNTSFKVEVIGIFNGDFVQETGLYKHKYGEASWNEKTLEMKLNKDDRGSLTFPALVFNTFNNKGNA